MYALRGAITADEDTQEAVDEAVGLMMTALFSSNDLKEDRLVSVLFSQTKDLRSRNAAAACRANGFCSHTPLFCVQEADTDGALAKTIRVLVTVDGEPLSEPCMVYLKGAGILRPDLRVRP